RRACVAAGRRGIRPVRRYGAWTRTTTRTPLSTSNRKARPYIPQVREAALQEFRERVGPDFRFAPVVALIAAYDEEDCIGAVIEAIAPESCGLEVDTLV